MTLVISPSLRPSLSEVVVSAGEAPGGLRPVGVGALSRAAREVRVQSGGNTFQRQCIFHRAHPSYFWVCTAALPVLWDTSSSALLFL